MPMKQFSPLAHIPLSYPGQNHIPASHLSPLPKANTLHRSSVFLLWPDHPLKLSSHSPGPSCWYTSPLDDPVHVQSPPDSNDAPLRSWQVGPRYSITQMLHIISYQWRGDHRHHGHIPALMPPAHVFVLWHACSKIQPLCLWTHLTFTSNWWR